MSPSQRAACAPAERRCARGNQKAKKRSVGTTPGSASRSAAGGRSSGAISAAAASVASRKRIIGRGGRSAGRDTRETCSQSSAPSPSGRATCRKSTMKKNDEAGGTSPLNERLIGSEKIGRRSSSRAPAMAIP